MGSTSDVLSATDAANSSKRAAAATKPASSEARGERREPSAVKKAIETLVRLRPAFTTQSFDSPELMRRGHRLERNIVLPIKAALIIILFQRSGVAHNSANWASVVTDQIARN